MIITNKIFRITFKLIPNVLHRRYCYTDEAVKLAFTDYNKFNSTEIPLIILPGVFGYRKNYAWMCNLLQQKLKPHRRILCLDLRNHGDSGFSKVHNYEAIGNDLMNFFKEHHLKKVIFVGHSMGGKSGMYIALKHPKMVHKIIVADTAPVVKLSKYRLTRMLKELADVEIKQGGTLMDAQHHMTTTLRKNPNIGHTNRAYLVSQIIEKDGKFQWRANLKALIRNYKNIVSFPIEPDSGLQYTGPALFVSGELSQTVGPEDTGPIMALFPNAEVKYIKGAAYRLHVENPSSYSDLVINFLK